MREQEKRLTRKEKDDLVAAIIDASNRIVESLKGRKPDRIAEGQADTGDGIRLEPGRA